MAYGYRRDKAIIVEGARQEEKMKQKQKQIMGKKRKKGKKEKERGEEKRGKKTEKRVAEHRYGVCSGDARQLVLGAVPALGDKTAS